MKTVCVDLTEKELNMLIGVVHEEFKKVYLGREDKKDLENLLYGRLSYLLGKLNSYNH